MSHVLSTRVEDSADLLKIRVMDSRSSVTCGEARIGRTQQSGPLIQPHIYRAPEIIFEMPWGSAVDIWNMACLVTRELCMPLAYSVADYSVDLGPF